MPILKIEKLTKKYGKTYALNGLDMEVKKGDIYGFVGPNGAGKTTTLRIISGLSVAGRRADDKKYSEAEKPDRLCA